MRCDIYHGGLMERTENRVDLPGICGKEHEQQLPRSMSGRKVRM